MAKKFNFASKKELEDYLNSFKDANSKDIILGEKMRRPIEARKVKGNNNVLVIGTDENVDRCGSFINPNILQMNSSYVVMDPYGESYVALHQVLENHGYKVKVFNLDDIDHSLKYNPLQYIRDDRDIKAVIDCLMSNTSNGRLGDEPFLEKAERIFYIAFFYYMKDYCTDANKKNLASIVDLVAASERSSKSADSKSGLDDLFESLPHESAAWRTFMGFKQAAGKTLKPVLASTTVRMQAFLHPKFAQFTQNDQLELENIGCEKTALFIIPPHRCSDRAFLIPMLYTQMIDTLHYVSFEQAKAGKATKSLDAPVQFLMNGIENCGIINDFPEMLSTLRIPGMSAMVFTDNVDRIKSLYKDKWNILTGNCSTIIFADHSDLSTVEYLTELLNRGNYLCKKPGKKMSDCMDDFSENMEIVITYAMKPILDEKYHYEKHPLYNSVVKFE